MTRITDPAEAMLFQIRAAGLPEPEHEWYFARPRRWRFDYAYPQPGVMVALEVEGGTWQGGRHVRGAGYRADCEKYSTAAILGWCVIRATSDMVHDGTALALLQRALEAANEEQHNPADSAERGRPALSGVPGRARRGGRRSGLGVVCSMGEGNGGRE